MGNMKVSKRGCPSIGRKGAIAVLICAGVAISVCIVLILSLVVRKQSPEDPAQRPSFHTGGDILDYLLNLRKINRRDGVLVTWFHAANRKSDMEDALRGNAGKTEAEISCSSDSAFFALSAAKRPAGSLIILWHRIHKGIWKCKSCDKKLIKLGMVSLEKRQQKGDVMALEADVTLEGYNTPNETEKPIMAHPPDVYSDNTLQDWLKAVLRLSNKVIKLDFKNIKTVGPSLDILVKMSSELIINRPVWLNADILRGPNVPFHIEVNASQFLSLILKKFPNCTLSPGWTALYLPQHPNKTYTQKMVEEMHGLVGKLPQQVTFPVRAVMAKPAWTHFSWLLSQSKRYSLTLWQGKTDPVTVEDLLFIRNNSQPEQIYYDLYEPVLSQFKQMVCKYENCTL